MNHQTRSQPLTQKIPQNRNDVAQEAKKLPWNDIEQGARKSPPKEVAKKRQKLEKAVCGDNTVQ
jgi:hypothetical protein